MACQLQTMQCSFLFKSWPQRTGYSYDFTQRSTPIVPSCRLRQADHVPQAVKRFAELSSTCFSLRGSELRPICRAHASFLKRPWRADIKNYTQVHTARTASARRAPSQSHSGKSDGGKRSESIIEKVAAEKSGIARVVLKKGKGHIFRDGNPLVFSGAIDRVVGRPPPKAGDVVVVADGADATIAWGIFNPTSMFRVRIMQLESDAQRDPSSTLDMQLLLEERVRRAAAVRQSVGLGVPGVTDVYRLLNSEGDRLSGLIVDILGSHIVVASSAAWVELYKDAICRILREVTGKSDLTWRASVEMLREEGIGVEPPPGAAAGPSEEQASEERQVELELAMAAEEEAEVETAGMRGEEREEGEQAEGAADVPGAGFVEVAENGVRYRAALAGQKTGFYADQRDSRAALRLLCRGKSVLDLCCYTGGFALNAALGGASHVTGVDSSGPALELARTNGELNGLDDACLEFVRADISDFMLRARREGRRWDLLVLDPPKLAPSRKVLQKAAARYRKLNMQAMQLVTPGGLLMTCSCSGAVAQSPGLFLQILQEAAANAGRKITILRTAGAGMDHPLDPSFPEGSYLTNVLLAVS